LVEDHTASLGRVDFSVGSFCSIKQNSKHSKQQCMYSFAEPNCEAIIRRTTMICFREKRQVYVGVYGSTNSEPPGREKRAMEIGG